MKVSVIIPVFNEEKNIGDCLTSLLKQSYKNFEVIVVDDGSTDNTLSIVSNYQLSINNFQLLKQEHKGPGAARNFGAGYAKGEILVFVDADMTFDKDFIRKLVAPIERGSAVGTFSKEELLENKNNVWAVLWNLNRGLPGDRMHGDNYPDKQKVFRAILKKEFEKSGGFNELAGYIDDWSISGKLGIEADNAPGAVFYHKNPDNLSEVFRQSSWMAKRKYKFGTVGFLIALIRVSLPFSILLGVWLALKYSKPEFLIFKIVSDLGQFVGIFKYLFGSVAK